MDEKAHKNEVRDEYLELKQGSGGDLFLPSDIGEISGHGNLALQFHDGFINSSDPDTPSLEP